MCKGTLLQSKYKRNYGWGARMPSLEMQKVVTLGHSVAISLPKAWNRFHRIRRGDVLEVVSGRVLMVRPKRERRSTRPSSEAEDGKDKS